MAIVASRSSIAARNLAMTGSILLFYLPGLSGLWMSLTDGAASMGFANAFRRGDAGLKPPMRGSGMTGYGITADQRLTSPVSKSSPKRPQGPWPVKSASSSVESRARS